MKFWKYAYENRWFARLSIVDKSISGVIGTVEVCLRVSDDEFNNMAVLRVDIRSDYENENSLYDIFSLIAPCTNELVGSTGIITKGPIYAVERIKAVLRAGVTKSEHLLAGKQAFDSIVAATALIGGE